MFGRAAFVLAIAQCAVPQSSSRFLPFKMNCGGPALPAIGYLADNSSLITSKPGFAFTSTAPVSVLPGENNMEVYKTERVADGSLTYAFPTWSGSYSVTTMHTESYFNERGKRLFSIKINGEVKAANVDIFARVGKNTALVLEFPGILPVGSGFHGVITVEFVPGIENPIVNAISRTNTIFECSTGNTDFLLRLNAGGPALGTVTADDLALISGPKGLTYRTFERVLECDRCRLFELYQTERYTQSASLTYNIPVPAGTYMVETRHSEGFHNATGDRVFDIEINGKVANKDVDMIDIFSDSMNVALILKNRVTMAAAGNITIRFLKVVGNPIVNGIFITGCKGAGPKGDILRMNVGGPSVAGYVADNASLITGATNIATNGNSVTVPAGRTNAAIYATERYTFGREFEYKFSLPPRLYVVTLQVAETFFNETGKRKFSIWLNNDRVESEVDVFDLVGKNSALELNFLTYPNRAGFIKIKLRKYVENPTLNGIMISSHPRTLEVPQSSLASQ